MRITPTRDTGAVSTRSSITCCPMPGSPRLYKKIGVSLFFQRNSSQELSELRVLSILRVLSVLFVLSLLRVPSVLCVLSVLRVSIVLQGLVPFLLVLSLLAVLCLAV